MVDSIRRDWTALGGQGGETAGGNLAQSLM
nr:MAG TPA: hypothetical protein [Caudoviricetes sp.]